MTESNAIPDNIFNSFDRLLGRQATEQEKNHLLRVKDALNLRDNDALWLILMSLEEYAYRFDKVPEKIRQDTEALIELHKKALETEAMNAAAQAQEKIADALTKRVDAAGIAQAVKTRYLVSLGWSAIALVSLGVICFVSGFVMGSVKAPWWTRPAEELTMIQLLFSSILMAPAGWIFSLLAVPCTGYYLCNLSFAGLATKEKALKFTKASLYVLATLALLYWTFVF